MHRLVAMSFALVLQVTAAWAQSTDSINAGGLSMEQQIKLGEILTKDGGTPVHGGNFSLAVGSAVPRQVELRRVPQSVDPIAPQLRGRSYVVVDEEIAIVDPKSRNIITVLPRWQSQGEGSATRQ